jgi:viologen exporter family transport system ATP-binding protein
MRQLTPARRIPARPPAIHVRGLCKTFLVPERDAGLGAATRSLFRRRKRPVHAVDRISFDIAPGEIVGFLGPNGAGKTTTFKMLAGLLHPTAGEVRVLGREPALRHRELLRRITLIMGNRNQLQWDLPAEDSFELHRAIYNIPWAQYRREKEDLTEFLDVAHLVRKPVRTLSLGERMKVELVASLLHRPSVLFLDEPTIGLDLTMQQRVRSLVAAYSRRHGATVLLSSHYMADVQALCRRVVLIDHGRVLLDDNLTVLNDRFAAYKELVLTTTWPVNLSAYGTVVLVEGNRVRLRVPRRAVTAVVHRLLSEHQIADLSVTDPPIDYVIQTALSSGAMR